MFVGAGFLPESIKKMLTKQLQQLPCKTKTPDTFDNAPTELTVLFYDESTNLLKEQLIEFQKTVRLH